MLDSEEVISRSASGLIKDCGDKAHVYAKDIADYLAVLGNNEGEALWRSIANTVEQCLRSSPILLVSRLAAS